MKRYLALFCAFALASGIGEAAEERELLITGCARSGTTYVARVMRLCGLDVGHEKDASYGLVSWPMTVNSRQQLWGPPASRYHFKHIFHQVRHPLKTIASFHFANERSWRYVFKHIPQMKIHEKILTRCAKYWVYWNKKAERRAEMSYRVENIAEAMPEMGRRLGVQLDPAVLNKIPKNVNKRPYHLELTWEILYKHLKEDLYEEVLSLAEHYGYDVSEARALQSTISVVTK